MTVLDDYSLLINCASKPMLKVTWEVAHLVKNYILYF